MDVLPHTTPLRWKARLAAVPSPAALSLLLGSDYGNHPEAPARQVTGRDRSHEIGSPSAEPRPPPVAARETKPGAGAFAAERRSASPGAGSPPASFRCSMSSSPSRSRRLSSWLSLFLCRENVAHSPCATSPRLCCRRTCVPTWRAACPWQLAGPLVLGSSGGTDRSPHPTCRRPRGLSLLLWSVSVDRSILSVIKRGELLTIFTNVALARALSSEPDATGIPRAVGGHCRHPADPHALGGPAPRFPSCGGLPAAGQGATGAGVI